MVPDARAVISFIGKVFGAEVILMHERPDGSVMHASIRMGDTVLMLADALQDYPVTPAWLHLYVDDVDATFKAALELGAQAVQEPHETGDGDRRGGFSDPAGITWWIATPTS
jgi:uncharacterized glyoxalase superfamily protein PhnB